MSTTIRHRIPGHHKGSKLSRLRKMRQGVFERPESEFNNALSEESLHEEDIFPKSFDALFKDDVFSLEATNQENHPQKACDDLMRMEPHYKRTQDKKDVLQKKIDATANSQKKKSITAKDNLEQAALLSPGENAKLTLADMAMAILRRVTIIKYDGFLYYYTGRTYHIIKNDEELLLLIRSKVSKSAFNCNSTRRFSDLLAFIRADTTLIPSDLECKLSQSQYYIVFQNGVLDLLTMKLLPFSPKYLTFYELRASWGKYSDAPEFDKFLEKISGNDDEIICRIMEVIGYLLSSINEGKCFFVMGTAPNSGKSTLGKLLEALLGQELTMSRSPHQMSRQFPFGDLPGKLLNLALDLPNGKFNPITVSIIKQITGGDTITVEQKYEKMRDVHSNMRFLFGSNFPVTVSQADNDDAFWDRMVIIPFLHSLEKEDTDPNILDKLLREKDAIMYKCLNAFNKVLKKHCIFSRCEAAEQMKMAWRYQKYDETKTMTSFTAEYLKITGSSYDWIYSLDLYNLYLIYCNNQGSKPQSYPDFLSWMCHNVDGCQRKRVHSTNHNPRSALTGIKLIEQEEDI